MKKIIVIVLAFTLLAGCAATNYKMARSRANDVKNGMTVAEAVSTIGSPPTDQDETHIEWRRGNAQLYDGTKNGSIRYQLLKGEVVGIPEGGIYSEAAVQNIRKTQAARDAAQRAQDQIDRNAREKSEAQAAEARAAAAVVRKEFEIAKKEAEVAKLRDQITKERAAERISAFTCPEKVSCTKAFALAQIFVSNNSDQKIQVATDTIIETYNPTDVGKLGMKIVKTPSRGTSEVISLIPNCKADEFSALLCSMRRTIAYEQFRTFIGTALSR